jgi:hypothetical protein
MKFDTTPKFLLPTTIYHFSTLGIVWSLFVVGPPTDEFLKNALNHGVENAPCNRPLSRLRDFGVTSQLVGLVFKPIVVFDEIPNYCSKSHNPGQKHLGRCLVIYSHEMSRDYTGCIKKLNRFEIALNFAKQLLL